MTHSRFNNLLIGLLFIAIALLILASRCHADDIDWHIGGYAMATFAGSMGYDDPGIGIQGEASARWRFLELYGMGDIAYQHKHEASSGYTYGYTFQGRGYVWDGLYLLAQWSKSGYRSEFETGTVWKKSGSNYGGGIGYNTGWLDVWLVVNNKEYESPNQVWSTSLNIRYNVWEYIWLLGRLGYSTWDQVYGGVTHRLSGMTSDIGIGIRW